MATAASPIAIFYKDPDALLDYYIDWSLWLAGDIITAIAWTVPAGITNSQSAFSSTLLTIWVSGGTDGTTYDISAKITTLGGRIDERTIRLIVGQR